MTLTLRGRVQTRLLMTLTCGLPAALVAAATLPGRQSSNLMQSAGSVVAVLVLMTLLGIIWEGIYHGLQQRRAERDWPSLVALLAVFAELTPLALAVTVLPVELRPSSASSFVVPVLTAWVAVWLMVQGPLRVLLPRWRLSGGQLW
ncbi:MAG: hypothetical protein ACT4PP_00925 [Sporichthyaceae bacterium]